MDCCYENFSWPNTTYDSEEDASFEDVKRGYNYTYISITLPIIAFCFVSVTVNLVILGSLFWVQRPVSPTLHISISLALSDLITLALDGICFTINSLLPIGFALDDMFSLCTLLFLEAVRLGCRFTTLGHLLALTVNHFLGISKPLQYPSLMTYGNITIIAIVLWVTPTFSFLLSFSLLDDDGFAREGCSVDFMMKACFRMIVSSMFIGSTVVMAVVYAYIYKMVRRHQDQRNRFRTAGSSYSRTRQPQEREARNEKALYTTMLIVGSTVLGWLPACLAFPLICEDCVFTHWSSKVWQIAVNSVINILLISKTALNTYIYAARMTEIKNAMRRMRRSMAAVCCTDERADWNGLSESRQFNSRNSTRRSLLHTTTPL